MLEKYEIDRKDIVLLLQALNAHINEHNLDDNDSPELELLRKWESILGGSVMHDTL
jgi:hypothetical protein